MQRIGYMIYETAEGEKTVALCLCLHRQEKPMV